MSRFQSECFAMAHIEDILTMQPFIDLLEQWGCQVLRAINRPNPYRGGFSILIRCEEETARAISDLGIAQILLDVRANTYLLRLPEVDIAAPGGGPQPQILAWTEESKREKLAELLALWQSSTDILERRRRRLGLFYKDD
ncbi:MAG: hypothetical protein ABFS19_05880 [Thermodesulfobacteriota bacterium]